MGANAQVFKYFKRDWLEPAVKQINEVSDLSLSYETRNEQGSRKIGRLRFRIQRKDMAFQCGLAQRSFSAVAGTSS